MGRTKKPKVTRICLVCGDQASGVNFNVLTCPSCKAFFRRNGFRTKEMKCNFNNSCEVNFLTRKFCPKCRLDKCFQVGMIKEWILSEEDKLLSRKHILLNRIQKDEDALSVQEKNSDAPSDSNSSDATIIDEPDLELSQPPQTNNSTDILLESLVQSEIISGCDQTDKLSLELNDQEMNQLCNDLLVDGDELVLSDISTDQQQESFNVPIYSITDQINHLDNLPQIEYPTNEANTTNDSFTITDLDTGTLNYCANPSFDALEPMYPEISAFPTDEFIEPEKNLLRQLTNACAILTNPYKKIQHYNHYVPIGSYKISQYFFKRLIRVCRQLNGFADRSKRDQTNMLRCNLMELLMIRSVLMFSHDRDGWFFVNDRNKENVLIKTDMIKPHCTTCDFERHLKLPNRFRDEWKRDNVIFDLLMSIVLYSPRRDYLEHEEIQEEHQRYCRLMRRYLGIKYPTSEEADICYHQLMENIEEMRQLSADIWNFFQNFSENFKSRVFFADLLNL